MNKANKLNDVFVNWLVVVLSCLLCTSVFYSKNIIAAVSPDQFVDDKSAVLELMRLETAQVLHQSREQAKWSANGLIQVAPTKAGSGNAAPVLKALYGVGRNITAEVQIGSQTLRYVNGSKTPLGSSETNAPLLLISINGVCITLSDKGDPYELCLNTR